MTLMWHAPRACVVMHGMLAVLSRRRARVRFSSSEMGALARSGVRAAAPIPGANTHHEFAVVGCRRARQEFTVHGSPADAAPTAPVVYSLLVRHAVGPPERS